MSAILRLGQSMLRRSHPAAVASVRSGVAACAVSSHVVLRSIQQQSTRCVSTQRTLCTSSSTMKTMSSIMSLNTLLSSSKCQSRLTTPLTTSTSTTQRAAYSTRLASVNTNIQSARPQTAAYAVSSTNTHVTFRVGSRTVEVPRRMLSAASKGDVFAIEKLRNIGISAHIDSGKTTLTERILFYTGRIGAIHEVRGKDGVGAKMDSMELEREKGITIQSAATHTTWGDNHINIIDTPGHVDFTIEVERALRVLDGAIMVLCGVAGVQSQSITVDRQMKRYDVPRIAFINKLDRIAAAPWKPTKALRDVLKLNAVMMQVPIGEEASLEGVFDLVAMKAIYFDGEYGETMRMEDEIPESIADKVEEKRHELLEALSDLDDDVAEHFLADEEVPLDLLKKAIRKNTIDLKLVPVFMGSAYKNKGVQPLLNAVIEYLPYPSEVVSEALDQKNDEAPVPLQCDAKKTLVALAFKLEESRFGQLTYLRLYQGTLKRGDTIMNVTTGRKLKVPRLVRMHSDEMEEIQEAPAGEIVAMFGVECDSGTTFTDGTEQLTMTSMFVPEPVMSLSLDMKNKADQTKFSKALSRFQREDPTFRVSYDAEAKQTLISGMGELHLDIYVQRMSREYKVDTIVGRPNVAFRETINRRADFQYVHKKQSGGSGQFGGVEGFIEPLDPDDPRKNAFENQLIGNNIPPEFHTAIEKGFLEACEKGDLTGHPIQGVKFVVTDGKAHPVDSNEIAFRSAAAGAFRQAFHEAGPQILEPIMEVEVEAPVDMQGNVLAQLNRRRAIIQDTESDEMFVKIRSHVPLNQMFGYATDLRSVTEGKGEFSMEYLSHRPMPKDEESNLIRQYAQERQAKQG
jgi:elongation factor G